MGAWNGPLWIPAWQLHDRDPTLIMWKVSCIGFLHLSQVPQPTAHDSVTNYIQAVYNNMSGSAFRRNNMARLHVYPEEEVEKADFKVGLLLYTHQSFRCPTRSWKTWLLKYLKWSLYPRNCRILQKRKGRTFLKYLTIQKICSKSDSFI